MGTSNGPIHHRMGDRTELLRALFVCSCFFQVSNLLPITTEETQPSIDNNSNQRLPDSTIYDDAFAPNRSALSNFTKPGLKPTDIYEAPSKNITITVLKTTERIRDVDDRYKIYSNNTEFVTSKPISESGNNAVTGVSNVTTAPLNNPPIATKNSNHDSLVELATSQNYKGEITRDINQEFNYETTLDEDEASAYGRGITKATDKPTVMNKNNLINATVSADELYTDPINISEIIVKETEKPMDLSEEATVSYKTAGIFIEKLLTSSGITKDELKQTETYFESGTKRYFNESENSTEVANNDWLSRRIITSGNYSKDIVTQVEQSTFPYSETTTHENVDIQTVQNVDDERKSDLFENHTSANVVTTSNYDFEKHTTSLEDIVSEPDLATEHVNHTLFNSSTEFNWITGSPSVDQETHVENASNRFEETTTAILSETLNSTKFGQDSTFNGTEHVSTAIDYETNSVSTDKPMISHSTDQFEFFNQSTNSPNFDNETTFAEITNSASVGQQTAFTSSESSVDQETRTFGTTLGAGDYDFSSNNSSLSWNYSTDEEYQTDGSVKTNQELTTSSFQTSDSGATGEVHTTSWDSSFATNSNTSDVWKSEETSSVTYENNITTSEFPALETTDYTFNDNSSESIVKEETERQILTTAQMIPELISQTIEDNTNDAIQKLTTESTEMPIVNTRIADTQQSKTELTTSAIDALIFHDSVDTETKTKSRSSTSQKSSKSFTTSRLLTLSSANNNSIRKTKYTIHEDQSTQIKTTPVIFRYITSTLPTKSTVSTQRNLKPVVKVAVSNDNSNKQSKGKSNRKPYRSVNETSLVSIIFPVLLGMFTAGGLVSLAYYTREKTCSDLVEEFEEKHPELYDQTIGTVKRKLTKSKSLEPDEIADRLDLMYGSDSSSSDDED